MFAHPLQLSNGPRLRGPGSKTIPAACYPRFSTVTFYAVFVWLSGSWDFSGRSTHISASAMSNKANVIEAKGTITKESGNGFFNVELEQPEGHNCLCRVSGRLITRKIQLLVGDKVTVELSPYDLARGRITFRDK